MSVNDEAYTLLNKRLDNHEARVWEAINELIKAVAELTAALKHPDPSHCTKAGNIQSIDTTLKDHDDRLKKLEIDKAQIQGGGKAVQWIINTMLVIIGILAGYIAKIKGGH